MSKPVKKRTYTSRVRDEQAALTRGRILEAAAALFERDGYARTTVKQIADEASVAVDTVYAVFGTKGRVLTALIDLKLGAGTNAVNVLELPDAVAIRDEPDQRRQIAMWARFVAVTLGRVGATYEMMRSAALVDDEMSAIYDEMQGHRLRNAKVVAGWIARNGRLGTTKDKAGELIWALGSPELASMLRDRLGWSAREYSDWLDATLAGALLRAKQS